MEFKNKHRLLMRFYVWLLPQHILPQHILHLSMVQNEWEQRIRWGMLLTMLDRWLKKQPHNDQKRNKQKKSHKQREKTESRVNVFIWAVKTSNIILFPSNTIISISKLRLIATKIIKYNLSQLCFRSQNLSFSLQIFGLPVFLIRKLENVKTWHSNFCCFQFVVIFQVVN